MGRKVGCYRRAERNQPGEQDFADYRAAAKAGHRADGLIEIVPNKQWRSTPPGEVRNANDGATLKAVAHGLAFTERKDKGSFKPSADLWGATRARAHVHARVSKGRGP